MRKLTHVKALYEMCTFASLQPHIQNKVRLPTQVTTHQNDADNEAYEDGAAAASQHRLVVLQRQHCGGFIHFLGRYSPCNDATAAPCTPAHIPSALMLHSPTIAALQSLSPFHQHCFWFFGVFAATCAKRRKCGAVAEVHGKKHNNICHLKNSPHAQQHFYCE